MASRGPATLGVATFFLLSLSGSSNTTLTQPEPNSTLVAPTVADQSFDAVAYVDEALSFIEANALYLDEVDWASIRESVYTATRDARSPEETHAALENALGMAGGRHSALVPAGTSGAYSYLPTPHAKDLPGGVVEVNVPGYRSPRADHVEEYAVSGAQEIADHAGRASCGWIIDLRTNYGGNMWPMLAALTPLLPDGTLMQFIDRDGNPSTANSDGNKVYFDDELTAMASGVDYEDPNRPVAIIQADGTASSAEAVILSFSARDGVRTFGTTSAGLVTGNVVKSLSDGTVLRVTRTNMATNKGKMPLGPIVPDVIAGDDPIQEASSWLHSKCDDG